MKIQPFTLATVLFAFGTFAAAGVNYYVNSSNGLNTNSGTNQSLAFQTIQRGVDIAHYGDTVWVMEGTYREKIVVSPSGKGIGADTNMLTIAAYDGGQVTIKGSDVLVASWIPVPSQEHGATPPGSFPSSAVYKQSFSPAIDAVHQVFANGQGLQQIAWAEPVDDKGAGHPRLVANMVPGSFYYDQPSALLYVWLPGSENPATQVVEAVHKGADGRTRTFSDNAGYLHLQNLTLAHSGTTSTKGASSGVILTSHDVMEGCTIEWMDMQGLSLIGDHATISRCTFRNNGNLALNLYGKDNTLSNCEIYGNNYRHFSGGPGDSGAIKIINDSHISISGSQFFSNHIHHNDGPGIWFDQVGNYDTVDPMIAPCLATVLAENGNLTGSYAYKVSFLFGARETAPGPSSPAINDLGEKQIGLRSIPIGNGASGRRIYRNTVAKGTYGPYYLVATIPDNITTTFIDNYSDAKIQSHGDLPTFKPVRVFKNYIHDNRGSGIVLEKSSRFDIYNNVIANNFGDAGIHLEWSFQNNILNNTVIVPLVSRVAPVAFGLSVSDRADLLGARDSANNVIMMNLFEQKSQQAVISSQENGPQADHVYENRFSNNAYWEDKTSSPQMNRHLGPFPFHLDKTRYDHSAWVSRMSDASIVSQPGFGPVGYALSPTSALRNRGTSSPLFHDDMAGNQRDDGTYDIGAFEYVENAVLTDAWNAKYGLIDSDGDGFTDAEEVVRGTSPTNASSAEITLHVDPVLGCDGCSGKSLLLNGDGPIKSLGRAVDLAQAHGIHRDTIVAESGLYAEKVINLSKKDIILSILSASEVTIK